MRLNLTKIHLKLNFDMPYNSQERVCNSDEKWRFFSIPPILASFYGQNPKMAIYRERLDRFQKFLRCESPFQCGPVTEIWAENSELYGPPLVESLG